MLRSNIAACYLKLEDWKAAVDSATASIDRLDKIIPPNSQDKSTKESSDSTAPITGTQQNDEVVEISGDDEEAEEKQLKRLKEQDEQRTNVSRIRAKALMRRAKAKSQLAGWANLQGAMEDYQVLAAMDTLPSDEKRIVQRALRELPERLNQAKEKEMGEMMSKMKDVSAAVASVLSSILANYHAHLAWKWTPEAFRPFDGQLQLCAGSQHRGLQHELSVLRG